jgi:fibro-slime domain-containing protein
VYIRRQAGIASSAIGVNGKPVYNPSYVGNNAGTSLGRPWTMDGPPMDTTGATMSDATGATFYTKSASNTPASLTTADQIAASYAQWYTDDPNATGNAAVDAANPAVMRITIQSTLALSQISAGTYQYYSSAFFPIDGQGFGNISYPSTNPTLVHNFSFTSEAHYWFQYNGGEQLEFRGDDDVWVFVNGQLSVDLGGIHGELRGIVTLDGATTQVCVDDTSPACAGQAVCDTPAPANCTTVASGFGLVAGNIYEIAVFQAERHVIRLQLQADAQRVQRPEERLPWRVRRRDRHPRRGVRPRHREQHRRLRDLQPRLHLAATLWRRHRPKPARAMRRRRQPVDLRHGRLAARRVAKSRPIAGTETWMPPMGNSAIWAPTTANPGNFAIAGRSPQPRCSRSRCVHYGAASSANTSTVFA